LKTLQYCAGIIAVLSSFNSFSQQGNVKVTVGQVPLTSQNAVVADSSKQKDLIDILQKVLDKSTPPTKRALPKKANFSLIPYGGYTLSTGFVADISGNVGFYTSSGHQENYSIIAADVSYDTKTQKVFLTRSEIWSEGNNFKLVSDLRFEKYPTDTYGLGTFTTFATDNDIDFYYLRIYETLLKRIGNDFYAGIGYNLDYHYDITAMGNQNNTVSDFTKYGQTSSSTSSGVNVDFLYDNRKNPLNPAGGTYASVIFRENPVVLGSNANWQSLQFDFRRYFKLTTDSKNVLAVWSMMQFTWGNVPYLDLPSTGGDMYNNSGRGYAVGRFRGRNELYLESEYRFGLTRNGLLGAVLFANGESFSELQSNSFLRIAPAAGTGLRIKINKHSNSNICIDYGVGTGGSHGFFVNLGEVF
jgi:outer membrane protein assembly factor BamA